MDKEKEISELIDLANEVGKGEDVIKMLKGKLFDVKLEKFLKEESGEKTAVELTPDDAEFKEYPLEPGYFVSKDGRVRGPKGFLLAESITNGRRAVRISGKDHRNTATSIAVMVAKTYGLLTPEQSLRSLEFIDGNVNNCHLENLRVKTSPAQTELKLEEPKSQPELSAPKAEGFAVYPLNPNYMVNKEGTVINSYGEKVSTRITQGRAVVTLVNKVDKSHTTATVASMVARTFGLITEEQSMRDVEFIDGDRTNVKLDNLRLKDANAKRIAEPEPEVIEEEEVPEEESSIPAQLTNAESLKNRSGRNSIPLSDLGALFSTAPQKAPTYHWEFRKRHDDGEFEYLNPEDFDAGVRKFSEQPATTYRIKKWWNAYKEHKQELNKEDGAWVHIYEGVYARRALNKD
jgi:hypothetical protein